MIWPFTITALTFGLCLYCASLRQLIGGGDHIIQLWKKVKVHCSHILVVTNIYTIQTWPKSEGSNRNLIKTSNRVYCTSQRDALLNRFIVITMPARICTKVWATKYHTYQSKRICSDMTTMRYSPCPLQIVFPWKDITTKNIVKAFTLEKYACVILVYESNYFNPIILSQYLRMEIGNRSFF